MYRAAVAGSPYVGVFVATTNDVAIVRSDADENFLSGLAEELDVDPLPTTIGGSSAVGALTTGNETGLLVSERLHDHEQSTITDRVSCSVRTLPDRLSAVGNVVLANDYGALVHPDLSAEATETVRETLDVPVTSGTIGGVQTVGTAAVPTNQGVLTHPKASDAELDRLEEVLDVRADVGTVNYGAPLVGSGLLANEAGYLVGPDTTGPELGRIEATLGFIE